MKKSRVLLSVFFLFALIYCSISLINHYYFRTHAFDLGIFNQAAYHYSTFQFNSNTVRLIQVDNLLSDHFSLILIPISFFRYIFGSYALLIVQVLAVLVGGLGIYKLISFKFATHRFATLALVHFFVFIGIFGALSFDYHNIVIAGCALPWFLLYLEKRDYKRVLGFAILIMICKENLSLLLFMLVAGQLLFDRGIEKKGRVFLGLLAMGSLLYFLLVLKLIMPALANEGQVYAHFKYSILGNDFAEGFKNILSNPIKYLKYLFLNHINDEFYDTTKTDFWIYFLISGGLFTIINPKYLPVTALILLEKMLNDDPAKWGVAAQYSITLAPLITISLFEELGKIQLDRLRYSLATMAVFLSASCTLYCMEYDLMAWTDKNNLRFYDPHRYKSEMDLASIHKVIGELPSDAKISAESRLIPHLAFRDHCYVFPWTYHANFIVLLPNDGKHYPMTEDRFREQLRRLNCSNSWEIYHQDKDLLIYRKGNQ